MISVQLAGGPPVAEQRQQLVRGAMHVARAQRLRGEILAASDRFEEAEGELRASVALATDLGTPREAWLAEASLARTLARSGRDKDAEASFVRAAQTIEGIAARLTTPELRRSFLTAESVFDVYRTLGRHPPAPG